MMNLARNSTILFVVTVCALSTCQSTEALPAAANPVNSPSLEKLEAMLKAVRVRRKGGMGDNGGKAKGMGMAMGKGKGMGMGVETASPTLSPTTSPTTSAPTTSPTASPSTTAPTTSPTFSPTVSPTASPTPECPTESEINNLLAARFDTISTSLNPAVAGYPLAHDEIKVNIYQLFNAAVFRVSVLTAIDNANEDAPSFDVSVDDIRTGLGRNPNSLYGATSGPPFDGSAFLQTSACSLKLPQVIQLLSFTDSLLSFESSEAAELHIAIVDAMITEAAAGGPDQLFVTINAMIGREFPGLLG